MKYWNDDFDTYAAETLDDIKAEMIANNIIDESDWEPENFSEVNGDDKRCRDIPIEDIDRVKYKKDPEYKKEMETKHFHTLSHIFNSDKRPESTTGKAWLICSTEY